MQSPGELFNQYYYAHDCGSPYARSDAWLGFFDHVAVRIIADFNPRTVLDAGCAWGFLVERLRARGVEAWGLDISEYAIGMVYPTVQPFCSVGSITNPLPQKYDLIVSIEVLEHMPPADSDRAIENLTQFTDAILVSTSPVDYKEATHFNVQQPDYWTRQFARFGFYRDVDYDASFITHWAGLYRRERGPVQSVVQAYERKLWQLKTENRELRAAQIEAMQRQQALDQLVTEQQAKIAGLESQNSDLSQQLSLTQQAVEQQMGAQQSTLTELQKQNMELHQTLTETQQADSNTIARLEAKLSESEALWEDLQKGAGWKLLQKMQAARVRVAPPGSRLEQLMYRLMKREP